MQSDKKLFRSKTNRMIAGVCGGIGEYFYVDPVIVRLVFILLALASGVGVLLYIIGIIIIPEENQDSNGSDKKEQKGKQELKDEIQEKVQSVAEEIKDTIKEHKEPHAHYRSEQIFGAILVFLGVAFLVNKFMPWFHISKLWPFILIIVGVMFLARDGGKK